MILPPVTRVLALNSEVFRLLSFVQSPRMATRKPIEAAIVTLFGSPKVGFGA